MNKKIDDEFKGINDVYVLQCTCTEMKELINKYDDFIRKYLSFDGYSTQWIEKHIKELKGSVNNDN